MKEIKSLQKKVENLLVENLQKNPENKVLGYKKGSKIIFDNRNEIFKFGDDLTDSLILYLERMRENFKKAS